MDCVSGQEVGIVSLLPTRQLGFRERTLLGSRIATLFHEPVSFTNKQTKIRLRFWRDPILPPPAAVVPCQKWQDAVGI